MQILMVTSRKKEWSVLAQGLVKGTAVELVWVATGAAALQAIQDKTFDLVLVDETLEDRPGLDLTQALIKANPMLNCALASALSADAFHEASEGLGLLAQLPLDPGEKQARELIQQITKIMNLAQGVR